MSRFFGAWVLVVDDFAGKLRSSEGNIRAYPDTMGEGNPEGEEGIFQDPVSGCQATRRTQIIAECHEVGTSGL